jgi:hypothetical protein
VCLAGLLLVVVLATSISRGVMATCAGVLACWCGAHADAWRMAFSAQALTGTEGVTECLGERRFGIPEPRESQELGS